MKKSKPLSSKQLLKFTLESLEDDKGIDIVSIDFIAGYEGIKQLPKGARFGVYIAYVYYYSLFKKIKKTHCDIILSQRVRISNKRKYGLFLRSLLRHTINWI